MNSIIAFLTLMAVQANSQWSNVREMEQEDGNHTYVAFASSDGNVIYTCGGVKSSEDDFVIEKSIDGGNTWVRQNTSEFPALPNLLNDKLHDIATFPDGHAIVVGDSGLVAVNNGGAKWIVRHFGKRFRLFDVDASATGSAVVTGTYGTVGISHDSGHTWTFREFVDSTSFIDCKVFGSDTIYLIDRFYANFLRSTNGGNNWDTSKLHPIPLGSFEGAQFYDSHFWNAQEGIVVGVNKFMESGYAFYKNIIVRTSNGGQSWYTVMDTFVGQMSGLQRVDFFDAENGIIGTRGKSVLITSDAGLTWHEDSIVISNKTIREQYDVLRTKDKFIACAKTQLGYGEIVSRNVVSSSVSNSKAAPKIALSPNPAASILNVNLQSGNYTSYIIYDELGRKHLGDKMAEPNFQVNLSEFPPGLYIFSAKGKDGASSSMKFIKQ